MSRLLSSLVGEPGNRTLGQELLRRSLVILACILGLLVLSVKGCGS